LLCITTSVLCSSNSPNARHPPMFTGCDAFGPVLHFCPFPPDGRCYVQIN
jgi:hypothetical protein